MTTATLESPAAPAAAPPPAPTPAWLQADGGPALAANRGPLLAALKQLAPLTAARTPQAVLTCYRITAAPDGVTIEASNLEQSARAPIAQAQVYRPGNYCVPADKLRDVVTASGAETVELDCGGGVCRVTAFDGKWTVPAVDPAPWHLSGEAWPEPIGTIPAADLRRLLSQTLPCVSRTVGRSAKDGVLLVATGPGHKKIGGIRAVATDGRRLAKSGAAWAGKNVPPSILPLVAAEALLSALPDEGDVGLWASAGDRETAAGVAAVCPDGFSFRSNVLEGQFPPYDDVIPKYDGGNPKLEADRDDLLAAFNRAAVVFKQSVAPSHGLRLQLGSHGLRLSARDPMAGESETPLEGGKFTGADLEIGFHAGFIADAVKACQGPGVTLRFGRPNQPVLVEDGDSNAVFVVMPVTLS